MAKSVLLLGATGLFGGHLARQLGARDDIALTIAGRTLAKLAPLATELGAAPLVLDRTDAFAVRNALEQLRPFAVIDCSGPFQNYGNTAYVFAEAVLHSGAHYLDIADDPEFVAGISALDTPAKELGLCAWSGASTTPALSSAIAAGLAEGLERIDFIETSILPGNKTPRGLSVMQAILGQVGKPFPHSRGVRIETAYGWADSTCVALAVGDTTLRTRLAALVNTPDVALFPKHFAAATVTARAGLELGLFHRALTIARYVVPALRITSLDRLSKTLLKLSNKFMWFGSDVGGMRVRIQGSKNGSPEACVREERVWDMIITNGYGPKTPVQPIVILLNQLLAGRINPGARPALTAFTQTEAEVQLATIGAEFERRDSVLTPIFRQSMGIVFETLPKPVQALHSPAHLARFSGAADVTVATTLPGKLAAIIGRFPSRQSGNVPAEVEIVADGQSETWTRKMGGKTFHSVLRYDPAKGMTEQFGPLTFGLDLSVQQGKLRFPIANGRAFGVVPIPRMLTPISETRESVDARGRFHFDVRLRLPNGALIVRYTGYLEPA